MVRKRKYEDECRMALEIASGDAGYQACNVAIAQAILGSPEHGIVLSRDGQGNLCKLVYRNEFGPTCSLDDIFERMTLTDWRRVAECAVAQARYGQPLRKIGRLRVTVTRVPEEDTDITSRVELSFYVNRWTYEALLKADLAKQAREDN